MSFRPIDKRLRVPTLDDADHKGRVQVWVKDEWKLVDWHTAATFKGVEYWAPNQTMKQQPA